MTEESETDAIARAMVASGGFDDRGPALREALTKVRDRRGAEATVAQHGAALFAAAVRRARGAEPDTDDRPLYWTRLELVRELRAWRPGFALSAAEREALLDTLEDTSRGLSSVRFSPDAARLRVLVTGFDPYRLTAAPRRGNPSGAAVLALDGATVTSGTASAEVRGAIFPVRFADFDRGLVERFFAPFLDGTVTVSLILTISQGNSGDFRVEEFAARRRSETLVDNAGALGGPGGGTCVPPGVTEGPEFLRTALPAAAIRRALGRDAATREETSVREIPLGATDAVVAAGGPTAGSSAVAGSGGNYLSNEIFYRTSALRAKHGAQVPLGHLHTPLLQTPEGPSDAAFAAARDEIVATVRTILAATLPFL